MSHKAVHDKKTISLCDDNTIIKADLAYFDDNGRKIMDTVWLDVRGGTGWRLHTVVHRGGR